MERVIRILVIGFILAIIGTIGLSIFAPHAILSMRDRSGRVIGDLPVVKDVPVIRDIIKPKPPVPLAQRLAALRLERGDPVFIRIIKESSELELWMQRREPSGRQWVLLHTYPICKWSGNLGPKLKEGDGQSPEGFYLVSHRALNPNSSYHLSFNLNFPNSYDREHGRTGSFLMVHGDCLSVGCYAMTDAGIEEIYGLVEAALKAGQRGVPTHVFPFRMTRENMARHADSGWDGFWSNLKEGWDLFEQNREPPAAFACGKRYRFNGASEAEGCKAVAGM